MYSRDVLHISDASMLVPAVDRVKSVPFRFSHTQRHQVTGQADHALCDSAVSNRDSVHGESRGMISSTQQAECRAVLHDSNQHERAGGRSLETSAWSRYFHSNQGPTTPNSNHLAACTRTTNRLSYSRLYHHKELDLLNALSLSQHAPGSQIKKQVSDVIERAQSVYFVDRHSLSRFRARRIYWKSCSLVNRSAATLLQTPSTVNTTVQLTR